MPLASVAGFGGQTEPEFIVALIIANSLRGCDIYAAHKYMFLSIIAIGGNRTAMF